MTYPARGATAAGSTALALLLGLVAPACGRNRPAETAAGPAPAAAVGATAAPPSPATSTAW